MTTCPGCEFRATIKWRPIGQSTEDVHVMGPKENLPSGFIKVDGFELSDVGPDGAGHGKCELDLADQCDQVLACGGDLSFCIERLDADWAFVHVGQTQNSQSPPSPTALLPPMGHNDEGEYFNLVMLDAECGVRTVHALILINPLGEIQGTLTVWIECLECGGENIG